MDAQVVSHGNSKSKAKKVTEFIFSEKGLLPYLFWLPTAFFLLFLVVYPTVKLVITSLYKVNTMNPNATRFVGLGNFIKILTDKDMLPLLSRTGVFMGAALSLELLLGFGLALLMLHFIRKGQNIYKMLLIAPMMMTPVAVGLIWRWLYHSEMGIVNYFLSLIHIKPVNWLGTPSSAVIAVIIVEVWQWTPFVFLCVLAGLSSLSNEPVEAARIDGANSWQIFWKITFPFLSPVLMVVVIFRFVDLFKVFDIIYVLTEGGPGNATEILPFHIYKQAFTYFNTGYASALSWLLLIFVTIVCSRLINKIVEDQI